MMQKVKQAILFLTVLNLMGINASVTSPEEGMSTGICCPVSPAGVPGIPGNPGPHGSKGDMGSPGDVGMHGAKGDKGSDGLNGERGATGEPGQKGEQGVGQPGEQGPQGLPGIAGLMGERGVRGPVGIQGIRGLTGPKGDMGSPGGVGMRGAKGYKGSIGLKGSQGQSGRAGLMGGKGVRGPVGLKGLKGECVERTRRVAFSVVRTTEFIGAATHLPFEEILYVEGTNFELSTGTFRCNVAGIYVLMFSFHKMSGRDVASASLMKNDQTIVRAYVYGTYLSLQGGNSAIVSLQEGDRVFLVPSGTLHGSKYHHTSFSGFLLHGEN